MIDTNELIQFSQTHPWRPSYPASLVQRFLTELISSQDFIFDLHDQKGRMACAVLLNKVNNPGNDACLEVLGIRPDCNAIDVLTKFITLAKNQAPANRSGVQIALHESFSLGEATLNHLGLQHYYDTVEMKHTDLDNIQTERQSHISNATMGDCADVYRVLCESFAQNPETSIPDEKTWSLGFLRSPRSRYYVWRNKQQILGFANLVEDDMGQEAEVRTIGVQPQHRGKSLGRHLLNHCLQESTKLGFSTCHLTVAVKNEKALGLYLQSGFKQIEKYKCFRIPHRP